MLNAKRMRLRAIEKTDLPLFVAWLNDPDVIRGLLITTPLSLPQEERWFERMLERPIEEQPLVIEVETPEGWVPLGNVGFNHVDWKERSAEVGIVIGEKQYWNKGYGSDAMRLILQHGFNNYGLNRIFLRVHATNPRAIRSYEKAGYVHEGLMRQAHFEDGKFVDVLFMSVLRQEWQDVAE